MAFGSGSKSEINVTPMIDVLLVLLIIFMVIQPTTPKGLDTSVPQPAKTTASIAPETPIVLVVGTTGEHGVTYRINDHAIERSAIASELSRIFAARQERVMFVKGDPGLEFSSIADVVGLGQQANVHVGLLTSEDSSGR